MKADPSNDDGMRSLAVLGATGSVGGSVLSVVAANPTRLRVDAVAGGRDAVALARVARDTGARFAAIADPAAYAILRDELSGTGCEVAAGAEAVIAAAERPTDLVVAAIGGAAGVRSTFAALRRGARVALANKESLVCTGDLMMAEAARAGAVILPLDSEHNALHQALGSTPLDHVAELVITASGGPFRQWSADRITGATPEDALRHPNWSMGAKITIDSASMMNKGLELIEAHHLFSMPADRLGVLVHPQSIVHGLVRFHDGAVVAGLAPPDMRVPAAHCLGLPDRVVSGAATLDLAAIATLTFERPDLDRFPALALAQDALRQGGGAPTVLNAANEVAVAAFLGRRIGFGHIPAVVSACLDRAAGEGLLRSPTDIDDALGVDHVSRNIADAIIADRVNLAYTPG